MRIAAAQLSVIIGHFDYNLEKIKSAIQKAEAQKADLIVFSELTVCGYPPRDFLEFDDFIDRCQSVIKDLQTLSHTIGIIIGAPTKNPQAEGKDLFNSAYLIHEGEVKHISHKALLPTYDVFDEYRYFEPTKVFSTVEFKGKRLAITICEDIWNIGNENPLYSVCPMDELIKESPDVMINISASPFSYAHPAMRKEIVKENCLRYQLPMFYVNHVGAQTELIFDGGSIVMNQAGEVHDQLAFFEEDIRVYELDDVIGKKLTDNNEVPSKIELMHDALVLGIRDYFEKLGFKKAILGLSGGIDSALTLVLAAEALGAENVLSVLMPSQFSSDHSVNDSVQLVKNLGSPHHIVAIQETFDQYAKMLHPQFKDTSFNVTEENIQARIRGNILMAMSNKFGHIVLNTTNKSEMAVGYGTLYGDLCGGLSVIADVYKMEVYEMARYINRNQEVIPNHIITKAPSAELRPNQKDSDSLPEYPMLDQVLFQYIEKRKGPKEIMALGFDEAIVKRALQLVNRSEYKRYQTAPVLRVSPKAFGMGRRMPIVAKYLG